MNIAVKYGLIAGLLSISSTVIFYVTGLHLANLWMSAVVGLMSMLILAIMLVYAIKAQRKANGNHISFKQAYITAFVSGLIAFALSSIYSYFHYNFIEPDFFDKLAELMQTSLASYGTPEDQIEKSVNDVLANKDKLKTFDFKGFGLAFAILALYSLLLASIMRKDEAPMPGEPMA